MINNILLQIPVITGKDACNDWLKGWHSEYKRT